MVIGAKVCELTEDLLWFVCGLYVGILTSPLISADEVLLSFTTHLITVISSTNRAFFMQF